MTIRTYITYIIALGIAVFEGFFRPGTVARRNNNPGNLRRWGDRPIRDGFAVFESTRAGFQALMRQVELNINRGLTLREFFAGKPGVYPGYAPATDGNDPLAYARFISQFTGIPVGNDSINSVITSIEQQFTQSGVV